MCSPFAWRTSRLSRQKRRSQRRAKSRVARPMAKPQRQLQSPRMGCFSDLKIGKVEPQRKRPARRRSRPMTGNPQRGFPSLSSVQEERVEAGRVANRAGKRAAIRRSVPTQEEDRGRLGAHEINNDDFRRDEANLSLTDGLKECVRHPRGEPRDFPIRRD